MSGTLRKVEMKEKIRRGEPITLCDLTFYPITMANYERFAACQDALALRLSTLPVRYAVKDYLSAIWALEYDAIRNNTERSGLFVKAMMLFYMSLRIDIQGNEWLDAISFREQGKDLCIDHIAIVQNGKTIKITPLDFSARIRPLIAEMNGIDLPNEAENAELIEAAEKRKEILNNGTNLKYDLDDLIASVAYQSRLRERDIYDWTVREFVKRKNAIERDKRYMMYGQAELGGMVTFKKGNPAPSWCFDALDDTLGTMAYDDLAKTLSGVASPQNPT